MIDLGIPPLTLQILGMSLLIFVLRVTDVSMGTVRTIMLMRGMRKWAALLGFVEVTIWVVAISQVLTNLDSVWTILGYSGGFASGTLLGMLLEDKLALGNVNVHVISVSKGAEIAQNLRQAGYGVTDFQAHGRSGPVSLISIVVPRKQSTDVLHRANTIDPAAFITIDDMRQVVHGYGRLAK